MKEKLYLLNSKSGYVNVKVLLKQLFSIIFRKMAKMVSPRRLACAAKVHHLTSLALILQGRDTRIEKGSYK